MDVLELLGISDTFLVEHDASRGRRDEVVLMQGRQVGEMRGKHITIIIFASRCGTVHRAAEPKESSWSCITSKSQCTTRVEDRISRRWVHEDIEVGHEGCW